MHDSLTVHIVDDWDQLEPARWNELAGDSPFRRWEWMHSWWQHLAGDSHRLNFVVVHAGTQLVAALPVYVDEALVRGRVLRFMGSGKACCDYLGVLLKPGYEADGLQTLCAWLGSALRGEQGERHHYHRLDLDGVAIRDVWMHDFLALMGECAVVDRRAAESCWQVDLPATWDDYLAMLSRRCRRMLRQLDKTYVQTGRAQFDYVDNPQQLSSAMQTLVRLHSRRRESLGCCGCFRTPDFAKFLHDAAEGLLAAGALRLSRVYLDGTPVASGFGMVNGSTYYLYQCGLAPEAGEHKPGWLMNMLHLRRAMQEGLSRFDFLRGNEAYKSRLAAKPVEMTRASVFSPDTAGRVRQELWKLRAWRRPTVPPE